VINYRDYLGQFDMSQRGNESWTAPMDEDAWNALDERGKWGSVSDTVGILQGDSRYGQFKPEGAQGTYSLNYTGGKPLSSEMVVDPSKARNVGNDIFSIAQENFTPKAQSNGEENKLWFLAPLLVMSAPLWAGALGIGAATEGAGLLGADAAAGMGASEVGTAAAAGSPGMDAVAAAEWFGGPGAATNPSPGLFGSSAEGLGAAGSAATDISSGLGEYGGLDPETWAGNGGMGVSQNGLGSWNALPLGDRLAGAIANPSSLLSGSGLLAQGAGGLLSSALSNPLQAAQLIQAFGGLLGGGNGGASNGDAPGGPSGPFAPLPKGNRGAWSPNSFTQNQIQNFKYTGSR
jgi:hypothetical protein